MEEMELNLDEMEKVAGGKGGSRTKLPHEAGYLVYRIQRGDTLSGIAKKFGTTAEYLFSINDSISDMNDITAGYYIYVPDSVG